MNYRSIIIPLIMWPALVGAAPKDSVTAPGCPWEAGQGKVAAEAFLKALPRDGAWKPETIVVVPRSCPTTGPWTLELSLPPPRDNLAGFPSVRIRLLVSWNPATAAGMEKSLSLPSSESWAGLKRFLAAAEALAETRAFNERYGRVGGWIERLEPEGNWSLVLTGATPEASVLMLKEHRGAQVQGYRLIRWDGLPVRRELLRLAEIVSGRLPGCLPVSVDVRRLNGSDRNGGDKSAWSARIGLSGVDSANCPALFEGVLREDGSWEPAPAGTAAP